MNANRIGLPHPGHDGGFTSGVAAMRLLCARLNDAWLMPQRPPGSAHVGPHHFTAHELTGLNNRRMGPRPLSKTNPERCVAWSGLIVSVVSNGGTYGRDEATTQGIHFYAD
jgi:hypothetical protein